jgi:hypothetical protein
MRTALCTIATGAHRELFEVARPSFEAFAALHGYELIVCTDPEVSAGRAPSWGKVPLLTATLATHDRAVWVDTDAVIVDPSRDIFAAVTRRRPLGLVVHHYAGLEVPNAGVLAVRRSRWVIGLLRRLWNADRFVDHKWWENAALLEVLGYDVDDPRATSRRITRDARRVVELDPAWNSVPPDPAAAPNIVHFAGCSFDERLTGMRALTAGRSASFD